MTTIRPIPYIALWLDWTNNFVSLTAFAAYYHITRPAANRVLCKGRILHETNFGSINSLVVK